MKTLRLTICVLILSVIACGSFVPQDMRQEDKDDRILWLPDRKLTWKDFKGNPKKDRGTIRAETAGEITTDKSYWKEGTPRFDVRCYFLNNESWTITRDSLTLQHEQIHFDIYELFTRKIRKSFDSLNVKEVIDLKIYEKIFNMYLDKNKKYNDAYDDDVRFERSKQEQWIEKVTTGLEELKEFEYIPVE